MDAPQSETTLVGDIQYARRDGVALLGDLYRPARPGAVPLVISIHGGNWDGGSRETHRGWGHFLASNGISLFAVDRHHFSPDKPAFPGVLDDFHAAIRYAVDNSKSLGIDASRIALLGDSSGGYIAALGGLTYAETVGQKRTGRGASGRKRGKVKAIVGIYGAYDLAAEWTFEQVKRPFDKSAEKLLGKPLVDDRLLYCRASPITYATRSRNGIPVFLAWGSSDDVVDENLHSKSFAHALAQANFAVTTVEIPSGQHFWFCDPIDEDKSHSRFLAPRLLRFLKDNL